MASCARCGEAVPGGRCPSCGAPTEDSGERDGFGDFAEVARVSQAYLAELLALRLKDAGIECQILDQAFNQEPVPVVPSLGLVRLLVPAGSAEEARRLLGEDHILPADVECTEEKAETGGGPGPLPLRSGGTPE